MFTESQEICSGTPFTLTSVTVGPMTITTLIIVGNRDLVQSTEVDHRYFDTVQVNNQTFVSF